MKTPNRLGQSWRSWVYLFCGIAFLSGGGAAYASFEEAETALQQNNFAQAFPLLIDAAKKGDARAMRTLGNLYLRGASGLPQNPSEALAWFQKGAEAGDAQSMNGLVMIYLKGLGVPVDIVTARRWALASANQNNAQGQCAFYVTVLNGPELQYRINGQPDMAKYAALARRPLGERQLEITADTFLAKAAAEGDRMAVYYTVCEFLDKVGPKNRERALRWMEQIKPLPKPLQTAQTEILQEQSLGESYTNRNTFTETQRVALEALTAGFHLQAGAALPATTLIKTSISHSLSDEVYLPCPKPLDHFYLISGKWQETWTFDVGGKRIGLPIDFVADGFGGATMGCHAPTLP